MIEHQHVDIAHREPLQPRLRKGHVHDVAALPPQHFLHQAPEGGIVVDV